MLKITQEISTVTPNIVGIVISRRFTMYMNTAAEPSDQIQHQVCESIRRGVQRLKRALGRDGLQCDKVKPLRLKMAPALTM